MEGLVQGKKNRRCGMNCYSLLLCLLAGLKQLRHCTCLQTLDVSWIPVTGSSLSALTSLRSLTARACCPVSWYV